VILHISGFGQTGLPEYLKRPSFDPLAQAISGWMNQNGYPDKKPIPVVPFMADYLSGLYGGFSVMAALFNAKRTGKGESIDLAQYEILLRSQIYFTDFRTSGMTYDREGSSSAVYAGWGTYTCKDGKDLYIIFIGGGVMKRGLPFIGLEYGKDPFPKGCSIFTRTSEAGKQLEEHLVEYLKDKTAVEAEKLFIDQGIPASRIMTYADIVKDPHVIARDIFADWIDFKGKTIKGVAPIPKLRNFPGKVWRPAPELGMDNEEILVELGYSSEKIGELYEKGVIGKDKSLTK
jgi:L-carnitine CoA-transferase